MATLQIRIDDKLKEQADELFNALGTDTTTAVRMFLTQAIYQNGFPFDIHKPKEEMLFEDLTEEELIEKLEQIRKENNYRDAHLLISELKKKYDL